MNINELRMCQDTEKLIKLLADSKNPTDIALIILANKIDGIDNKIKELNKATEFARWIDHNKKSIITVVAGLVIFAAFGVAEFSEFVKSKLGF